MSDEKKYVVGGEYPQRNAMGGHGSEWQSKEMSLEEAKAFAKTATGTKIRIHEVKGHNGANYPIVG